jgi:hypothetical protein
MLMIVEAQYASIPNNQINDDIENVSGLSLFENYSRKSFKIETPIAKYDN